MGLINFLKEKFAKRREEKQRAKEEEVQKVSSGQEEGTPLSLPAKDESKAQEETLDSERKTSQEEDSPLPQAEKNEEKAVNAESFSQDVTALPAEEIASEETPDLAKAEEETASEDGRIPEEKEEAIALAEKEASASALEEARRRGAVKNITVHSEVSDRTVTAGNQISVELGAVVECTAEGSFGFI